MEQRTIHITENDLRRLKEFLQDGRRVKLRKNEDLDHLEAELARAKVVPAKDVPADVITMNSSVQLVDLDTHEETTYTLVFPKDADMSRGKISVLAPIGTAMLGYRVGDTFTWKVPQGVRRFQVKKVLYQPEAAGDLHL